EGGSHGRMVKNFNCKRCAKCCSSDILVTILDLERIARHLKISNKLAFNKFIRHSKSKRRDFFILKKQKNKKCIFMAKKATCKIYSARPTTCRFYICDPKLQDMDIRLETKANQRRLMEYSKSVCQTKEHIKKYGLAWREEGHAKY
ncbi:YkgJ family cysteine cluster protein, partial [Thermoproteota archaeon]